MGFFSIFIVYENLEYIFYYLDFGIILVEIGKKGEKEVILIWFWRRI
jgi:hypothetical protein